MLEAIAAIVITGILFVAAVIAMERLAQIPKPPPDPPPAPLRKPNGEPAEEPDERTPVPPP